MAPCTWLSPGIKICLLVYPLLSQTRTKPLSKIMPFSTEWYECHMRASTHQTWDQVHSTRMSLSTYGWTASSRIHKVIMHKTVMLSPTVIPKSVLFLQQMQKKISSWNSTKMNITMFEINCENMLSKWSIRSKITLQEVLNSTRLMCVNPASYKVAILFTH